MSASDLISQLRGGRNPSLALSKRKFRNELTAFLYLAPAMAFLAAFIYFPTVLAFLLAFFHYQIGGNGTRWAGLDNFRQAFQYDVFWRALLNTLYYAVMVIPSSLVIATAIALLINKASRLYSFVRTLVLLPYVTPAVGTAIGWLWIYEPSFGLANALLKLLHLPTSTWLQSPYMALPSVAIYSVWHGVGFDIIIIMSALNAVPRGMLEASYMDGAGAWKRFWSVTLPLISPTMYFLVIITTIGSLQAFSQVYALSMGGGGPEYATTTTLFLIYETAFQYGDYSYAAAMAIVLVMMILGFTLLQRWIGKKWVYYQ